MKKMYSRNVYWRKSKRHKWDCIACTRLDYRELVRQIYLAQKDAPDWQVGWCTEVDDSTYPESKPRNHEMVIPPNITDENTKKAIERLFETGTLPMDVKVLPKIETLMQQVVMMSVLVRKSKRHCWIRLTWCDWRDKKQIIALFYYYQQDSRYKDYQFGWVLETSTRYSRYSAKTPVTVVPSILESEIVSHLFTYIATSHIPFDIEVRKVFKALTLIRETEG